MLNSKIHRGWNIARLFVLICASTALTGCFAPKTPQAVTKAFWQAVIANDTKAVMSYSSLSGAGNYDGFGLNWQGFTPTLGRIVIDGNTATVDVSLKGEASGRPITRQCVTYLVRSKGIWKVDYQKTAAELQAGALGKLFSGLGKIGKELSRNLDRTAEQLNAEMDRLAERLKQESDKIANRSARILDERARDLQQLMQELSDSINKALRDHQNNVSPRDRQVMVKVSSDLQDSSSLLSQPSVKSLQACNNDMRMARQQLHTVYSEISPEYRQHWQGLQRRFDKGMQQLLNELSGLKTDNPSQ